MFRFHSLVVSDKACPQMGGGSVLDVSSGPQEEGSGKRLLVEDDNDVLVIPSFTSLAKNQEELVAWRMVGWRSEGLRLREDKRDAQRTPRGLLEVEYQAWARLARQHNNETTTETPRVMTSGD